MLNPMLTTEGSLCPKHKIKKHEIQKPCKEKEKLVFLLQLGCPFQCITKFFTAKQLFIKCCNVGDPS